MPGTAAAAGAAFPVILRASSLALFGQHEDPLVVGVEGKRALGRVFNIDEDLVIQKLDVGGIEVDFFDARSRLAIWAGGGGRFCEGVRCCHKQQCQEHQSKKRS